MRLSHRLMNTFGSYVPGKLRTFLRDYISLGEYDRKRHRQKNIYNNIQEEDFPDSPCRLGIISDFSGQMHRFYIDACKDMNVSYRVLDLVAENWLDAFHRDDCDAYLVWPTIQSTTIKQLFDDRLYLLETEMGKALYPTWKECWLTEHKPRLRDWLGARNFPQTRTWVFYERQDALDFAETASLPLVVKTAMGASASGVKVIHQRSALRSMIRRAFDRGLRPRGFDANDRQWGFIYIQEYLPDVHEWRMVRIGDSFFGYRKERGPSGLHSASHDWSWLDPGPRLLDLLRQVTNAGGFTSMDVDVFQTLDDQLFISELQTVFGCWTPDIQMKIDNVAGRYRFEHGNWQFEPGIFCANQMCNLRIKYLLAHLTGVKKTELRTSSPFDKI